MLYRIYLCYFDEDYGTERKKLCAATTNKAEADEVVKRMNAISKYNNGDTYEIVKGEQDLNFVASAERRAIEKANDVVYWKTRCVKAMQRDIDSIMTVKSLFENATKAPKDMVPEMIAAIKGTECGLFVCEYVSTNELVMHYPDGKRDVCIGENYEHGSYLGIEDSRFRYSEKWDYDKDIERIEEYILEAKAKIAEAKAFLEKMSAN